MKLERVMIILGLGLILGLGACKEDKAVEKIDDSPKTTLDLISEEISKEPSNPDYLFKRAQIYFEKANYDAAINDLRDAILIDSMVPDYYHLLSDAFMDNTNSNRSLLTMQTAASLFPERTMTLLKLAETHYILQQYEESVQVANSILMRDADNAEAYFMLGMNFKATGEEKAAINSFQKATELDPNIIDAWIILGNIFDRRGESIAEKYFESAVNIAPDNVNAIHAKAFYLQNNDDIPGALQLYRKINRMDREYIEAYLNAGILYNEMDSLEQAYEQFNIMATVSPANSDSYYYRAFVSYRMGRIENAKRDIQNALNINPDNTRAKELLELINEN